MRIEHVALNVADPVAMAEWYVRTLGMSIVRQVDGPPFTRFIADSVGRTMLELYKQDAPIPDYAGTNPFVLHVAFVADDIEAARARLLSAGATAVDDIKTTPAGDRMTFLRDPWGVVIQLLTRKTPM